MTDERLKELLHQAMPLADEGLRRDVWPQIASRFERGPHWSYFDLGLATAAVVVLVMFPEWLWLLVYHL